MTVKNEEVTALVPTITEVPQVIEASKFQETKIFSFEDQQVDILTDDQGNPWFIGSQIAKILGYSNAQKAVRDHVDAEDKLTERIVLSGQNREVITINESGMYSLILSSKLDSSKRFKRWITNEILPSIRKYGVYAKEDTIEQMLNDPDSMITILQKLKEERAKAKELKNENVKLRNLVDELAVKAKMYDKVVDTDGHIGWRVGCNLLR